MGPTTRGFPILLGRPCRGLETQILGSRGGERVSRARGSTPGGVGGTSVHRCPVGLTPVVGQDLGSSVLPVRSEKVKGVDITIHADDPTGQELRVLDPHPTSRRVVDEEEVQARGCVPTRIPNLPSPAVRDHQSGVSPLPRGPESCVLLCVRDVERRSAIHAKDPATGDVRMMSRRSGTEEAQLALARSVAQGG